MFDYTNGKDYTYPDGDPGICFGFEFKQTSTDVDILNTYELDLFFDDQAIGGSDSVGISPSTQQDAYDSLASMPSVDDPKIYLQRGFSMLQNLGANIALMIKTQVYTAQITLYSEPMAAT